MCRSYTEVEQAGMGLGLRQTQGLIRKPQENLTPLGLEDLLTSCRGLKVEYFPLSPSLQTKSLKLA